MSINTTKPKRSRKTRFIVDSAGIRHALTAIHALVEFQMLGLANFKYSMYCVILIPNISFSCVYAPYNVFLTVFMLTLASAAVSMILLVLPLNNNKLLFT